MEDTLLAQVKSLRNIVQQSVREGRNTRNEIRDALNELREIALGYVPANQLPVLERTLKTLNVRHDAPYTVESGSALVLADQIMSILAPRSSQSVSVIKQDVTRIVPDGSRVFIIHGHDTVNTLRLRTLLKEHYGPRPCNPIGTTFQRTVSNRKI